MIQAVANRDRAKSLLGVAVLHVALGYALVAGLGLQIVPRSDETVTTFDVAVPPPPPPEMPVEVPARAEPEPAAAAPAPPAPRATPAPVVAPPREVELPVAPTVAAAPLPAEGRAPAAGAATAGTGTGAQGSGTGTGAGGAGTGTGAGNGGGGGVAVAAALRSGRIVPRDYPRAAGIAQGAVDTRLAIAADGSIARCTVIRSSGNAALDAATCRLMRERFRFTPARDGQGNAVADVQGYRQTWWRTRD